MAIGSRTGGAHAYPRFTTFFQNEDGLNDQLAAFNLYGGSTASNVGPITGAAPGWLIAGNRVSGPAVWHSTDGREFTIEEDVPGLADEEGSNSLAQDAAWDGSQWVVVGGGSARDSIDREPFEWVSADARHWERGQIPGSDGFDDLERVVSVGNGLVALGLRGARFGAWLRTDAGWTASTSFGKLADDAHASPFVSSLAGTDGGLWATTSDGKSYGLWRSEKGDSWSSVHLPASAPETGADHILTVAAHDGQVLLLADDGTTSRSWVLAD